MKIRLSSRFTRFISICIVISAILLVSKTRPTQPIQYAAGQSSSPIKYVWFIQEENQNWTGYLQLKGNSSVPYMNNTLVPLAAHAEQFFTTAHPSLPNYIWNESGSTQGVIDDNPPSSHHFATTNHLTTLLQKAGFTWKTYAEGISGTNCPITGSGIYVVRHVGVLYFDDVTNGNSSSAPNCISHVRPYIELSGDLKNGNIANFNDIVPNVCDDMHGGVSGCGSANLLTQSDTFLKNTIAQITATAQYKTAGAIVVTFDEGHDTAANLDGDGPLPAFVLSPFAKVNYSNSIHYTHSSTLKTFEEIFGLNSLLGGAADASTSDLGDLFQPGVLTGSNSGGGTITNTPSTTVSPMKTITPTPRPSGSATSVTFSVSLCLHGLGNCGDNVSPSAGGNTSPLHPSRTIQISVYNSQNSLVTQNSSSSITYSPNSETFTGIADMGSLAPGSYLIQIGSPGYLSKSVPGIITVTQGAVISLTPISLVTGDINNDDQIDIQDYNILISCFGTKQTTSACTMPPTTQSQGADITDDGSVDGSDYNEFLRELSVQK